MLPTLTQNSDDPNTFAFPLPLALVMLSSTLSDPVVAEAYVADSLVVYGCIEFVVIWAACPSCGLAVVAAPAVLDRNLIFRISPVVDKRYIDDVSMT